MQLCLGQYITTIDVKAAEGKLAGTMSKNGLTTAVSKHNSDQDCYIPCSKDCVLTAVMSKNSIKLRCLVLTLIAIPLDSEWISLHTLLHLVDGNNRKRILALRTYVHNVDSKPLCASPKVLYQVRQKDASPKVLYQVRQKDASQTREQHPECLQSVAKVKLVFGPKLQQWLKKIAPLGENEASGVSILGKDAPMSQHSSRLFCSNNSLISNLFELDIDSSESYTMHAKIKNGLEYVKSSNNGAIAVANKEGSPGFNLSRSYVAETLLVTQCRPVLACELFSAPNSSANNFNGGSGNGVDINTCQINSLTTLSQVANNPEVFEGRSRKAFPGDDLYSNDYLPTVEEFKAERFNCNPRYCVDVNTCQINSVTSLSQLANDPAALEARNRQHLPRHDLCSDDSFNTCSALLTIGDSKAECLEMNDRIKDQQAEKHIFNTVWKNSILNSQIEEALNLQSGIIDRNSSQCLYFMKVKSEEHVSSHTIGNWPVQVNTDNNQRQLDQAVNVGATSFAGQSGSRDRNSQRNVNSNTDSKSEMTIGSGLPSSYSITNRTDSTSSSLTKGSDTIFHGTGDSFGRNCSKDSGRRHTDQNSSESRKEKDKGIDVDEKVGKRTAVWQSREAPSDLHKSRRAKSAVEHSFVRETKCSGNSTASESSSCESSRSIGPVYGYGTSGKGNNFCVWKKVQKNLEDGHINEPKTIGHVQLNSAKEPVKSLTTTTPVPPKVSQKCKSWVHNCEEQYQKKPEGEKEHSRLQGETASDDISSKLHVQVEWPGHQLVGQDASVPLLPSRAKGKQNTRKVNPCVTKTGKAMWARKTGSSTMDDSKSFSQKEDVDNSQQSNCSKGTNIEAEETRLGSHCAPDEYGCTMQVSRDSFSSARPVKIHSSLDQTLVIPGTSKAVGQAMLQTKLQENQIKTSGQPRETQGMVDEALFHPLPWKARATTIAGKGLSCERNNERHRSSQQVAQKWVPVESKSGKASATDKAVADSHGSTVICRIADEVRNKEDDSSGLSQASSADTQIIDFCAKTSVLEMPIRDSKSHTQSKIMGCPLNTLKETDTFNSDHTEYAVSETKLVSDAACMGIANELHLHDESNTKAQSVLKSIDSSYQYKMMSEHIAQGIGSPIAEFEKVLNAMSPIVQVPDKQTYNPDRVPLNKSLICNCQIPNIPLKNIWQWYEEPGNYGLEVKARDLQHSARLGIEGNLFCAYFVPFLSGMQLFGSSKASPTHGMGVQNTTEMVRNTMYGNLPILATLLPKPTIADDSTVPEYLGSSSDLCAHYEKHVCSCDVISENIDLLFEFFECEQPHQRRPMFDKIKELTKSGVESSSQHSGDPCILNSLKIGDLHPASWFAVAWYPIYRVPEGQLRAAFLTYHSLGRFAHRNSCCNPVRGTSSSIVAPAVGLQSYSSQAECWFHLRKCCGDFPIEKLPSDPSEIMQGRLRTLEETAALMSRGLTKTQTPLQRNKHSDYEFFVGRQR